MLFDSHAHFDDEKFDAVGESGKAVREELLERCFSEDGIGHIVSAGTNISTSRAALMLAERYPQIYATAGIHPQDVELAEPEPAGTLGELRRLLANPKVRALGEIGLDYHWDDPPRELQKKWFRLQLELAAELDIPVQIHDRDAHGDCMDILREYPDVRGVFHSFSGSAEMAAELVRRGWYISFSGVVTFKNAQRMADVVRSVPPERIMAETDSPYLAPHPLRGSLNYSGNVRYTVQRLAELKDLSFDEMSDITYKNACDFFGIAD